MHYYYPWSLLFYDDAHTGIHVRPPLIRISPQKAKSDSGGIMEWDEVERETVHRENHSGIDGGCYLQSMGLQRDKK